MSSENPGLWARINGGLEGLRRILANVGFMLLLVLVVLGLSQGDGVPPVPKGGALVLTLDGPLVDAPPTPDPLAALLDEGGPAPLVLTEVLRALKAVESDSSLRGVVLDLDAFPGTGFATLERLGAALADLRAAGKTVVTHSEGLSQGAYYLASFSDELYLDPEGALWLRGLASEPLYFGAALDRLKVSVEVLRAGRYKTAVEPLLRNDMSPEAREANQALIDNLWAGYAETVVSNRQMDGEPFDRLLREWPQRLLAAGGDSARLALEAGLVDELLPRDARLDRLQSRFGADPEDPLAFQAIGLRAYLANRPEAPKPDAPAVAVIVAEGTIAPGPGGDGEVGDDVVAQIHDARLDETVAAVVLRVNSPGGAANQSEQVRRALALVQSHGKPVVVSMGDVAASGGYWISSTADHIVAEAGTITGSIGAFALGATFEDSAGALGVTTDGVQTHPLAGATNALRPLNPGLRTMIQAGIDHTYAAFRARVAEGRGLTSEAVDALAEGRVWSGRAAYDRGLVDTLGGLEDAIGEAARLAELEAYRVQRFTPNLSPLDAMLSAMLEAVDLGGPRPSAGPLGTWLATFFEEAQAVLDLDYRRAGVLVWCPRCDALTP